MTDRPESFPLDRFDPIGHWVRTAPSTAPTLEPLKGTRTFQTVIIGGGFTGLSTAIALAERGHKVAVIEKAGVGGGASGWNCGQVALDLGLNAPVPLFPALIPRAPPVTSATEILTSPVALT
jgi:hypothetical protein